MKSLEALSGVFYEVGDVGWATLRNKKTNETTYCRGVIKGIALGLPTRYLIELQHNGNFVEVQTDDFYVERSVRDKQSPTTAGSF